MQRLTPQGSRLMAAAAAPGSASFVVAQEEGAFDGGARPGAGRGGVDAGRVPGEGGIRSGHGPMFPAASRVRNAAAPPVKVRIPELR
jgi:hypothetical protein